MEAIIKGLFELLAAEAGLLASLLFVIMCASNVVWYRLHAAERSDRREAWTAYKIMQKETLTAINEVTKALTVLTMLFGNRK
jgi:hypothetical protein